MDNDDSITLGGLPAAFLEARRAKRDSERALAERPTQPMLHARGEMPDGYPAPVVAPPDRRRALDLARAYLSGGEAQRVVGRDGCEEMARWIEAQPDYVSVIDRVVGAELVAQRIVTGPHVQGVKSLSEALADLADAKHRLASLGTTESPVGDVAGAIQGVIDEWLIATVAVERMRARGEQPSEEAMERMDVGERGVAEVSSLDRRFSGWVVGVLRALKNRRKARCGDGKAISCERCGMFMSAHRTIAGEERCPEPSCRAAVRRIWTPRDDRTCGVCGLTEGEHIEIRAEIRRGMLHCPAEAR